MAPIVDNDVNALNFLFEPPPEIAVALIANKHFDGVALIRLTGRLDIDAINLAARPEVIPPHLKTPAAVDPDLKNADSAVPESPEVAVVNVKVMTPLPDSGALRVRIKEKLQRIRLVWRIDPFAGRRPRVAVAPGCVAAPERAHLPQDLRSVQKSLSENLSRVEHSAELLISDSRSNTFYHV